MIITDFIMTSVDNIQQYQNIAKDNKMHSFTIISIEDGGFGYKKMTFSFDAKRIAYLITDIFYAGKKASILESKSKSNETAY